MEKMIGACGLPCSDCEGYKATQTSDADGLARIAAKASEQSGEQITADSIRCDGCLTDSASKCGYCGVCQVRACLVERGLANCAHCADYGCEKIAGFHEMVPHAKENLEHVRAQLP